MSVIGIGFTGTVFEKLHDEDHSTRMIKIQFQAPSNSISCTRWTGGSVAHLSQREDRDSLLVPGNRPKLINALLEHSHVGVRAHRVLVGAQGACGMGCECTLGEHNDVEKEYSLKGHADDVLHTLRTMGGGARYSKEEGPAAARRMQSL